jgi:peptidoglycan L-alanyl-D-glutamate endopeptidase CwlK
MSQIDDKTNTKNIISRDLDQLAPFVKSRVIMALNDCHDQRINVHVFEGYRTPERQQWLYEAGRDRAGIIVTKARPWQSAHQFGLAVDLAFGGDKAWTWQGPWDQVIDTFSRYGFESLSWEKAHQQILGGYRLDNLHAVARSQGLIAAWDLVERAIAAKK